MQFVVHPLHLWNHSTNKKGNGHLIISNNIKKRKMKGNLLTNFGINYKAVCSN